MHGPENLRVYGLLLRDGLVLVSAERVAGLEILKFPGGGVEPDETPEHGLSREFQEECGLEIEPVRLIHAPGTLFSDWTRANYTPLYYEVSGGGEVTVPAHEPVEMRFMAPDEAIASRRMAEPEIFALNRLLGRDD